MQRATNLWVVFVLGLLPLLMFACGDAAKSGFEAAAELDRSQQQYDAALEYAKARAAAPDSHFGKLAGARAEVLLLELGAQYLQADDWGELAKVAGALIELDAGSMAGHLFMGYAAMGRDELDEASAALEKAGGEPRGVAPPSSEAIEATAKALFKGATQGAESALNGSIVDEQFLKNSRTRLKNQIAREKTGREHRAELIKQNTLDSMATLLDTYPESSEASKIRATYAKQIAAKLKSVESIGPPVVEDPDPITTLADALERRAPEEAVAKTALARVEQLREAWNTHYEEQLKTIDEQVDEYHAQAIAKISAIIQDKCLPLKRRAKSGDEAALGDLVKARDEAAKLIPNGMTEEDLNKVSLLVLANCTLPEG